MPEVVPYFRKAAILSDIGWLSTGDNDKKSEDQSIVLKEMEAEANLITPSSQCPQGSSDSKIIPLSGAFVRRLYLSRVTVLDQGLMSRSKSGFSPNTEYDIVANENSLTDSYSLSQEVIVILSPDLFKSCIFRFDSDIKCCSWFSAIQKTIYKLNLPIIQQLNQKKQKNYFEDTQIVHIGWFIEKKNAEVPILFNEVII